MSVQSQCDYCHLPVARTRGRLGRGEPVGPVYCCYGCSFAARITQARGEEGHVTWMLTRLGVAIFLSMGVMVFTIYLYGEEFYGRDAAGGSALSASMKSLMRYSSLVFATPVFFILGLPILSSAIDRWKHGVLSTDALMVLGVAAAFIYSYVSTLTDAGSTYYETACMILVLVTLGRWLEASGKLKSAEAVKALATLIPPTVAVRRGDAAMTVRCEDVRTGDLLDVPAGQRICVDGVVVAGRANVDEQIVTGESAPLLREPDDFVRAGTVNLDGSLVVRAAEVGSETTLGRLIALLEAAKLHKGKYERLADRAATVFLPLTVSVAAVGAVLGYTRDGIDEAIMSALAVLLIACPCALGIATPMAVGVALGRAAKAGVLFRHGEAMERLATVRTLCFDKTGTLTTGQTRVGSFTGLPGAGGEAKAVAAGLAAASRHVASQGITAFAQEHCIEPAAVIRTLTVPGRGLVGEYGDTRACLGNVAMMREQGLTFDETMDRIVRQVAEAGEALTCVGWGERVRGVFALREDLREAAGRGLRTLESLGCRVFVLTGDHRQRGRRISELLDVETIAELLPADKVARVTQMRREAGAVAMVGDGLNDAPALEAADVGIAMGCGADITRQSASICLLGDDLGMVPWIVKLARRTVRTIRLNLFWAFAFNSVGMALAVTGSLSPIFAALAMVASSLLVVTHSLRLDRFSLEDTT